MQILTMSRMAYRPLAPVEQIAAANSTVAAPAAATRMGRAQLVKFPYEGPVTGREFDAANAHTNMLERLENGPQPSSEREAKELEQKKAYLRGLLKQYAEEQNRYAHMLLVTHQFGAAFFEYSKGLAQVPETESQLRIQLHRGLGNASFGLASWPDRNPIQYLSQAVVHLQKALDLQAVAPDSNKQTIDKNVEQLRQELTDAQKALTRAEAERNQKLGAAAE